MNFAYNEAFSRNLGWITPEELTKLSTKVIAIAGMGGVGGLHLINLVRMGFVHFHLAEFDQFEIANFNRQYGADISTLGLKKLDVMIEKAKLINPNLKIKSFSEGINKSNVGEFLNGVDLYLDGLDAFVFNERQMVFRECRKEGIPVTTVGPIGFGAAGLNFIPTSMSFDEYFGFKDNDNKENGYRFLLGIAPSFLQLPSLVDRSYSDLDSGKGPSTPMGVSLAAGVACTEVVKILLNRQPILASPWSFHFDAHSYRFKKKWMPLGAKNPIFLLKLFFIKWIQKRARNKRTRQNGNSQRPPI